MKFKEMSWEELKKDFAKILDSFTTEELVESLREYAIDNKQYTYESSYNEETIEEYPIVELSKKTGEVRFEVTYSSNINNKIDIEEIINLEDAA